MRTPDADESRENPDDPIDPRALDAHELITACKRLHAAPSDLRHLLAFIHAGQASRQQIPAMLRQAYARLSRLRERHAGLSSLAANTPEIGASIGRATVALGSDAALSLDDADRAYNDAYPLCIAAKAGPDCVAAIRARQAEIAAAKQDYRRAANLLEEAAATPGLESGQRWRYATDRALMLEDLGRERLDSAALEEAIALYQDLIVALVPRDERPADWATTQNHLGRALGLLGRRQTGTGMLEEALAAFERALSERSRERAPLEWATTQNDLGNVLGILGQRRGDNALLERSVEAFEQALSERSPEGCPEDWAVTENNLGAVLLALGQRKKDAQLLSNAIDAYKKVLEVWTRETAPLEWATALDNVGTALRILGEVQDASRPMEQAVAAYRNALAERTRERVPADWAMTQNNLGAALHKLGERLDDPRMLADAVEAYENALQEWTLERAPMAWAMTKANLGVARRMLAKRAGDVEIARLAMADLDAVMDFFRAASHAHYYELAEEQLNKAELVLQALEAGIGSG